MSEHDPDDDRREVSRRDFQKLLGVSGVAVLGGVSLAGCQGNGELVYRCPYGDQTFETEEQLKDHLVSTHGDELRAALGAGPYQCPYGDQEFDSLSALRSHIKAEHADEVALPEEWDEEVEVAVVGSGFAGLAAAIEATEADATVKIYEKMPRMGGNSRINGGWLGVVGSDLQEAEGVEDSVELFMEDLLAAGRDLNYPELVRFLGENTEATWRWTVDHLGVEYQDQLHQLGGHSVFRTLKTQEGSGWGIVRKQIETVEELGVETETSARLDDIIRNQAGEVLGLEIRADADPDDPDSGETKYVRATSGVVLATGGFSADVDMRTDQWPSIGDGMGTTNQSGATGEALRNAIKEGATPVQLSWIQLGPWACPEERGFGQGSNWTIGTAPYGIWVDPETGERFVDEVADRRTRAQAQLAIGSDPDYPLLINDAVSIENAAEGLTEELVEKEIVYEFESLDALAEHFGIPAAGLSTQVSEYNTYVENDQDEQFGKPIPADAAPLETPPWYAMRIWPKVHHTMGGVAINTDAQVLEEDEPIPNLYAAGEVTGGIHGASRLGSIAIPDCLSYGRVAGAKAAGAPNPYT
jgi:flavocytochrome c